MKAVFSALVLVVVVFSSLTASAQDKPVGVSWTEVPGTGVVFATWFSGDRPYYAVSLDGGLTTTVRPGDYRVMLRYAKFDPLVSTPEPLSLLHSPQDSDLWIVQYWTHGLGAYRDQLARLGAEVLQFIPKCGNLVRVPRQTLPLVESLPFVRWIGRFHPAYRIDELMLGEITSGSMPSRDYWIHVTRKGPGEKEAVRQRIVEIGGAPHDYISPHGFLLRAHLNADQLLEVIRRDDVLFVDRWGPTEVDMNNARTLGGANYVETVAGFTGQGVRGEARDTGLNTAHTDFQARPPIWHTSTNSDSHGTACYGINFGDGTTDPNARGLVPDAQGIMAYYAAISDRYVHTGELNQPAYECLYQTSSVGSPRTFFYTNISADMDNILFDHDTIKTQSQSNAGNQDSRPEAWAKNIVSGGGVRHLNTLTTTDDNWTGGASIGPAQDGRIKPDLCAFYDNILTTTTGSATSYTTGFGGTSGATPIIAGHFGIFFQMWNTGIFGNPVIAGGSPFSNRPHMTTSKAMMLNTSSQYPFSGTGHDLTRVHQGWGRPNVQTLYDQAGRIFVVDETELLVEGASRSYDVTVQATDPEFRATLVFADPPGNPSAAEARINDLTLRVFDPNGNIYWGNNGLLANTTSVPGGSPNTVDTVEQVIVDNPTAGIWTVEVICTEINQDGHVETNELDADYALVIRGVDPPGPGGNPLPGQPNSLQGSLNVLGATNANGQPAATGINGPFAADLSGLNQLTMIFGGPAHHVFLLLLGHVNANNAIFPGVGSLDLGLNGAGNLGDIVVLLDGLNPNSFLDDLAGLGVNGSQTLSFGVPASVTGQIGGFQAAMIDPNNSANVVLTAAFDVSTN